MWRDRLHVASFRGVAFHVQDREERGGRRVAEHEFPLRDIGVVEDLGLRTPRFQVTGYVLGPDYTDARDRLVQALEAAGPGTFLDRYGRGERRVVCPEFRFVEREEDGGYCQFSISFVDAGELREPAATSDTRHGLLSAVDDLGEESAASFQQQFTVAGQPDVVERQARLSLAALAQTVAGLLPGRVRVGLAPLTALVSAASGVVLPAIADVDVPQVVTDALTQAMAGRPLTAVTRAMLAVADGVPIATAVEELTPSRAQRNLNSVAIAALARRSALAVVGRSSASSDLAAELGSLDQAEAIRSALVDRVDREMESASAVGDRDVVRTLDRFASAFSADLSARGQSLRPLRTARFNANRSAIVLAHRLYGTTDAVTDLHRRAGVPHPGFMPSSVSYVAP